MVGFHYFQNTPWPLFNRANAWGNCPFTFILMLSGAYTPFPCQSSNQSIHQPLLTRPNPSFPLRKTHHQAS